MIEQKMDKYVADYVFKHTLIIGITDKCYDGFYVFFNIDEDNDKFLSENDKHRIVDEVNKKSDFHDFKDLYFMRPNSYCSTNIIYEDVSVDDIIEKLIELTNEKLYFERKKIHEYVVNRIASFIQSTIKFKDDPFGQISHLDLIDILIKYFGRNFLTNFDKIDYEKIKSENLYEVKLAIENKNFELLKYKRLF